METTVTSSNTRDDAASEGTPRVRGLMALLAVLITSLLLAVAVAAPLMGAPAKAQASILSIQDPTHPVADAGPDFSVLAGAYAVLNASASTDDVGIGSYVWTFFDVEPVTLEGKFVNYSFLTPGVYFVTLNVTDTDGNWDTDEVYVTVNRDRFPPVPIPGANRTVYLKHEVVFNGSRSRDNTGRIVSYTWNFTHEGRMVYLYGPVVSYKFNKTGVYIITLNVTDPNGLSANATIAITVKREPTWFDEHWLGLIVWGTIIGLSSWYVYRKWTRDHALVTKTNIDKMRLEYIKMRKTWNLFWKTWMGKAGVFIILFFLFVVAYATLFMPYDRSAVGDAPLSDPSWEHPFGTDMLGRDVLTRTAHATKASLIVGFVAMAISMGIGTSVGLASGYWGGWRDEVIMRVNDVFLSIPWLVLMIVIAAIFHSQNLTSVILVIGLTGWSMTARIVRSQVLAVKTRMFVERARALGARDAHILRRHILPNVVPLVFANAILTIALAIFSECTLSFLGLGPQDVETWGRILEEAYKAGAILSGQYAFIIMPGLCIVFVVLGFAFVGYAMDEVLNPKLRRR
jgi:peptide/nickel transport system permease protein